MEKFPDCAMTREEVAESLGITVSRVQQLEASAMRKLAPKLAHHVRGTWEEKYDRLYRQTSRGAEDTPEAQP